jgi:glycine/D-amino acid oxidase-like deaminating enzyme
MSAKDASASPESCVIVGAGIVGTCTAFYLAKNHGIRCTLIDVTGTIAPAASGKAGGFLAKDWNDGSPTQALTHRSFALHQELAEEFGADTIQYRRLTCSAIAVPGKLTADRPNGKKLEGLEWAARGLSTRLLGDERNIAQVHPKRLCERLWEATQSLTDSKLLKGRATRNVVEDGKVVGVQLEDGTIVSADAVLYACGPWTANIMKGIKYHSAVVPTDRVLTQCVFFSGCGDPEVYVRPDQTAYLTGFPDPPVVVREQPGQEAVQEERINMILHSVQEASGEDALFSTPKTDDSVVKQACYLPSTDDGLPVMGRLEDGSYIASGHTCWGILLGPASGENMAALTATGESSTVDLSQFDPRRFRNELKLVP